MTLDEAKKRLISRIKESCSNYRYYMERARKYGSDNMDWAIGALASANAYQEVLNDLNEIKEQQ